MKYRKTEYSKKLLDRDYKILVAMLVILLILIIFERNGRLLQLPGLRKSLFLQGRITKSKSENLVKLPILLLRDLPDDMREKAGPNQIIDSVPGIGTNNNNSFLISSKDVPLTVFIAIKNNQQNTLVKCRTM